MKQNKIFAAGMVVFAVARMYWESQGTVNSGGEPATFALLAVGGYLLLKG